MKKNKLLAVLSTVAISSFLFTAVAMAADGDVYDLNTHTLKYSKPTTMVELNNFINDLMLNKNKIGYEYNGKVYKAVDLLAKDTNTEEEFNAYLQEVEKDPNIKKEDVKDYNQKLVVEKVSAITDTVDAKASQELKFAINGQTEATDEAKLTEAGYTVTFLATDTTNVTPRGIADGATIGSGKSFEYQVVISKDGKEVVKSDLKKVTVKDYTATVTAITSYTLKTSDSVEIKSGKIALSDVVTLGEVKGTLLDGNKDQNITGTTFKSSNNKVALIGADGKITPITAGSVVFTITKGDVKIDVPVEIVTETRKATTVTADATNVKLVNGGEQIVNLVVKDQYGDLYYNFDLSAINVVKTGTKDKIATISDPAASDKDGKIALTVKAEATNVGTGNIEIKSGDNTLLNIPVSIESVGENVTRKLETSAEDNVIDINNTEDNEIVLNYNKYNENGYLIGAETNISSTTGKTYTVTTSDNDIATVAVDAAGAITVTAGTKTGTVTVKVLEGTVVRASYTVEVKDSTPSLKTAIFNSEAKITEENPYALANVVKEVKDADGKVLFLHTDGNIYTKADGNGKKVGSVELVSADLKGVKIATGNIQYGDTSADPKAGDKGTIIVKVLDTSNSIIDVFELTVDVPASK